MCRSPSRWSLTGRRKWTSGDKIENNVTRGQGGKVSGSGPHRDECVTEGFCGGGCCLLLLPSWLPEALRWKNCPFFQKPRDLGFPQQPLQSYATDSLVGQPKVSGYLLVSRGPISLLNKDRHTGTL